ncbi:uncharacterized protein PHACADRAFT_209758 [Phanerochaete carnosa HHB-10118-sp]|uniref:F-box domain-containing protein n=1 Tax=Phanerochaete carnosa (strain HHB-10118-sp) TaxID=650164 RepID=K5WU12_PHACS|nr:uncharacterized protein PHACADRAFT_209758 [Phanerochaete carnosa HHB-10118-sp]EKM53917.1 hypothetical protein PHACADRAFT_209758 [Phanerochaete carnosa HHB-10118-sp]
MQYLAQELVDHIIDTIADTPNRRFTTERTLATCTLVARAWLPRSSTHLFERIALRPDDLEQFFSALETCHRLVANVAELELTSGPYAGLESVAALLLLRPPRLRRIVYQDYLLLSGGRGDIHLKHARVPMPVVDSRRLTHLKLQSVDAFALSQLLAHFDDLDTLELDPQHRYPFYRACAESPWPIPPHLRVRKFILADVAAASALGYVRVLRAHLSPSALKIMAFKGFCADKDGPYVNGALRDLSRGAEDLSLCFYDKDITIDPESASSSKYHMAALEGCSNVQRISISFIDCRQQFPWACESILPYLSLSIRRLILLLCGPADLRRLVHARMDTFERSLAKCDKLEALEIRVTGAAMWANSETKLFDEMRDALPKVLSGRLAALTSIVLL